MIIKYIGDKIISDVAGEIMHYTFKYQAVTLKDKSFIKVHNDTSIDHQLLFQSLIIAGEIFDNLRDILSYESCSYTSA